MQLKNTSKLILAWLKANVEVITPAILACSILYLAWGIVEELPLQSTMRVAALIIISTAAGTYYAWAVYQKRLTKLLNSQVEREAEMLERFRMTILDLMSRKEREDGTQ